MSFKLKNKVALVTGSSKGLGKAIALKLAEAGAKVAINYCNNIEKAELAFSELKAISAEGMLVRADVSKKEEVDSLVKEVEATLGQIDIVVCNATPAQPQKSIEEYSWQDYMNMIDFFIKSPYLLSQAILPSMKARKYGRFINICSEVYGSSVPNFSAYVAAKGGQLGWTRSMASELAPWNITVNAVSPGWIPVERHEMDPQDAKDAYLKTVPLGHWGKPEDVANAVLYFASDEAGFVTGDNINVCGYNNKGVYLHLV